MSDPGLPSASILRDAGPGALREEHQVIGRARRAKEIAYLQLKEFLIIFLYLWVIFVLFELHKAIILSREHLDYKVLGFAVINALALGKVMLVAKELHLADNFKARPLIYPTLLKAFVFALLLAFFKVLEEVGVRLYHGRPLQESLSAFGDHEARVILSAAFILFLMLIPFFGFSELSRHFGEGRLATLFLRSRHNWLTGEGANEGATPTSSAASASISIHAEKSAPS